jgi:hypothetical protein
VLGNYASGFSAEGCTGSDRERCEKYKMKLQRALLLILGVLLGVLWADLITPRVHSGPHDYLYVSPPIVGVWAAGWIVIVGFIALLTKLLKKK